MVEPLFNMAWLLYIGDTLGLEDEGLGLGNQRETLRTVENVDKSNNQNSTKKIPFYKIICKNKKLNIA